MTILAINEKRCSVQSTTLVTWRDVIATEEEQGSGLVLFFPLLPFHPSAPTDGKPLTVLSLGCCRSVSFEGLGPLLLLVLSASVPCCWAQEHETGKARCPTLNLEMLSSPV